MNLKICLNQFYKPVSKGTNSRTTNMEPKRIAVVGAGTVGLSVAYRLTELYPSSVLKVTVFAKEFLQQTTSYGSGGLWEPYQIAGTPDERVNAWGKVSFDHFKELYYSEYAAEAGVQLLTAYQFLEEHQDGEIPSWNEIVFNFKSLDSDDLKQMSIPPNYAKGFSFGTFVIEQKYYMQYLTRILEERGVEFVQKDIADLDELSGSGDYDCVINCSGLGASKVAKDASMYPIRGQVLRVRAPWIKNIYFFGTSYIIPNVDNVVLGGTAQRGNWDTTVSIEDTKMIVDNIAKVFPSIRQAKLEHAWAGLRPGRSPLRLDTELQSENVPVVHCYGHGGSGITIAMGCAHEVVAKHVQPLLQLPTVQEPLHRDSGTNQPDASKLSTWMKYRAKL